MPGDPRILSLLHQHLEKTKYGMLEPGNIPPESRPVTWNNDGSYSTTKSIIVVDDKNRAILLPSISPDGKQLSTSDAIDLYKTTGKHLGVFKSEKDANNFDEQVWHPQQEQMVESQLKDSNSAMARALMGGRTWRGGNSE